ncbi:MAG: hypothetical protein MOGMAGMI_01824 [Candidatus Omnitrophica bacterium]|nr:hypothetical protein [Ignavibacteriaceae bacterium]MCG3176860.1 hypothetical protein [Candidatus Omnitrophota bacterium]
MENLKEKIIEFAYECAEEGLHSKDSDDLRKRIETTIDIYMPEIMKATLDAMIMESDYNGKKALAVKKSDLWVRVLTDYMGGMSASDIAKRYYNPKTKKPYTRGYVYWVIQRLKQPDLADAIKSLKQR